MVSYAARLTKIKTAAACRPKSAWPDRCGQLRRSMSSYRL